MQPSLTAQVAAAACTAGQQRITYRSLDYKTYPLPAVLRSPANARLPSKAPQTSLGSLEPALRLTSPHKKPVSVNSISTGSPNFQLRRSQRRADSTAARLTFTTPRGKLCFCKGICVARYYNADVIGQQYRFKQSCCISFAADKDGDHQVIPCIGQSTDRTESIASSGGLHWKVSSSCNVFCLLCT